LARAELIRSKKFSSGKETVDDEEEDDEDDDDDDVELERERGRSDEASLPHKATTSERTDNMILRSACCP
jgi:hypothetical protein